MKLLNKGFSLYRDFHAGGLLACAVGLLLVLGSGGTILIFLATLGFFAARAASGTPSTPQPRGSMITLVLLAFFFLPGAIYYGCTRRFL